MINFITYLSSVGSAFELETRVVYPKKYPYPIPENFGSSTGIYPISIPVKVSSPTPSSYPIPERNTQHVGYEIWFDLGVFLRLFAPNSVHTHTQHPIKIGSSTGIYPKSIPDEVPHWVFSNTRYSTKGSFTGIPIPVPILNGFFRRVHNPAAGDW